MEIVTDFKAIICREHNETLSTGNSENLLYSIFFLEFPVESFALLSTDNPFEISVSIVLLLQNLPLFYWITLNTELAFQMNWNFNGIFPTSTTA